MSISPRRRGLLLGLLLVTTLFLAAAILGDWLPRLRGPAPETSEWYWPYALRPVSHWIPSLISSLLLLGVASWWLYLEKPSRGRVVTILGGLFLGSLAMQLSLIYADRPMVAAELIDRTLSNQASGFFEPAAEIEDMGAVLRSYAQEMPLFTSEHARTHPPGLIVGNWAAVQAFAQVDWVAEQVAGWVWPLRCTDLWLLNRTASVAAALGFWAVLPLLAAASTVFPAYALSGELLGGRARRLATILAATLPALLLFAPKSVQLYAPLTLALFWTFQRGLSRRAWPYMLLAGLIFSLLSFLSLGNLSLLLLLVSYALLFSATQYNKDGQDFHAVTVVKQLAGLAVIFSVGAVSLWAVLFIGWGTPPWAIAVTGLEQHYQLVTTLRSYSWWIGWNLVDLTLFAGWPLMVCYAGSIILAAVLLRKRQGRPVDLLALSLAILILFLNFSGSARGEVGRLWLFFMPLLAFPAARLWHNVFPGKVPAALLVAMQLLMVLALGWAWRPVRAVIVVAQPPQHAQFAPDTVVDDTFISEPLALAGYSVAPTTAVGGSTVELTLLWRAQGPASRPFTVFNHLLNDAGELAAQADGWAVGGQWPPSCWRTGEQVVDRHTLELPENLPAGDYRLVSGLYDSVDGRRLLLEDGRDAVELGVVKIIEP